MDPQAVLESLATEKGVALTRLDEISTRFSQSAKVACCGGLMTRLVTESAADSTVLLRDGSGSCYCALHGDITHRYPDVLTTGALLLFTEVTVLVVSSKVPPMLIACLQNLAGLLLPEEASSAAAAAAVAVAAAGGGAPFQRSAGGAGTCAAAAAATATTVAYPGLVGAGVDTWPVDLSGARRHGCDETDTFNQGESYAEPNGLTNSHARPPPARVGERGGVAAAPAEKRTRTEGVRGAPAPVAEVNDEDDADCLELADDM